MNNLRKNIDGKDIMTRLKKLIDDKGVSQKELAEKSEIAEYRISTLCSGTFININFNSAIRICNVLKCTLDDAFGDLLITKKRRRKRIRSK